MFDPHWQELPRKRQREDEQQYNSIQANMGDGMNGTLGFTEHRNKRLQSLPLRTSPTQKRWSGPPGFPAAAATAATIAPSTITPTNSDSEDTRHQQHQQQSNPPMDIDRDMDMMIDSSSEPFQPGPSQADSLNASITGRLPTPIHCTFAAQVRGQSWGSINQTAHATNRSSNAMGQDNECDFAHTQPFPTKHDESSVPRSLGGAIEWSMVQTRRLPSPISESGGEDPPASPGMVLDCTTSQPQRPYLPHMPHSTNPHAMALHPNIQTISQVVDNDAGMMDTDPVSSPSSAPATPSPRGKFGHSRSKHTVNNWTLQPGMKKSFSIGYRADCEKCRMKVPGHFNHIIIS